MDDLLAAIVGYLAGRESVREHVRFHRLAFSITALFVVGVLISEIYDGNEPTWNFAVILAFFSALCYVVIFAIMKCLAWFDCLSKRRRQSE